VIRQSVLDAINDAISLVDQEIPGTCFVICYVWNEKSDGFLAARYHMNCGPMCEEIKHHGYQVILEFSRESWSLFWLHTQYGLRLEALREIVGYLPNAKSISSRRTELLTLSDKLYLHQSYSRKQTMVKPWTLDN